MSIIKFNPFSGQFDLDSVRGNTVEFAAALAYEFNCEATAAIGDLVQHRAGVDETVDVVPDNSQIVPAIGIVRSKPTATKCQVLLWGIYDGPNVSGLTVGAKVYVSPTGDLTSTKPALNYIQTIGEAITPSVVIMKPSLTRVKQV